jgi:hypothetical protein
MTPQALCRKPVENRHPKTRMNAALAHADWTYAGTIAFTLSNGRLYSHSFPSVPAQRFK